MEDRDSIPLSRRRVCCYCLCTIDSNGTGVFQLAHGWLENRKRGGANAIAIPIREDTYACAECIDKLRHKIPVGQARLFEPRNYDNR